MRGFVGLAVIAAHAEEFQKYGVFYDGPILKEPSHAVPVVIHREPPTEHPIGITYHSTSPGHTTYEPPRPHPVPVPIQPAYEYKHYPVYNKSNKFTDTYCPKPGYHLTLDSECCREVHCPSRLECPFEFTLIDDRCFKYYEPTVFCKRGTLANGRCRIVHSQDAVFECPEGAQFDGHNSCVIFEEYTPIQVCPPSTIRSKNGCLAVEYTEPALVCPPDTVPEGKKCRREIVTLKMKKGRLLGEADADETEFLTGEEFEDMTPEELEAMGKEAYSHMDIYADVAVAPQQDCDDCYDEWLPATSEFTIKTRRVKQPIVSEQLKWEKVKIPVTTAKVKDVTVKVPEVKVKLPKEKVGKSPHEVVKVVTQAAEKICPVGVKHGSTCVAETIVPPILECPHPQLGPDCARKIVVPPLALCEYGELVCDGYGCRCEEYEDNQPEFICSGGHELVNNHCVIISDWQRMCPIGYFLEKDGATCSKTDCEPALTIVAKPVKQKPKKLLDVDDYMVEEDY